MLQRVFFNKATRMNEVQDYATSIREEIEKLGGTVLGSQLAQRLRSKHPELSFADHGGLSGLIRQACPDTVSAAGRHGQDVVWSTRANAQRPLSALVPAGSQPTVGTHHASLWQAFTHPAADLQLVVRSDQGRLEVLQPGDSVPEGAVVVPKASQPDHRRVAEAFLAQVSPDDQESFKECLASEDYWSCWARETRTKGGGKYYRLWLRFRSERLKALLRERLTELHLSVESVDRCITQLTQERVLKRPHVPACGLAGGRMLDQGGQLRSSRTSSHLRDAIIEAVGSLSEEDLRRIWLPVGVVADALRRR